jgi:short-subunit dehydrogenase
MKKAIIIGATSGIGKSLCEILIQQGYVVGITGRRIDLLQSIQQQHPDAIYYQPLDVQDLSTLISKCDQLVSQLGGMDLLVISSGVGEINKELSFDVENNTIRTNVQGFTAVADWGMTYFKKQGFGHLVNISSVAGIRGNGDAPAYFASKAFQINYLEGMRLNASKAGLNIYVTDVRPGFVDTAMALGDGLFWVAPVEKAAKQIFSAIQRKKKVVYISKRWASIGYALKVIPYRILKWF